MEAFIVGIGPRNKIDTPIYIYIYIYIYGNVRLIMSPSVGILVGRTLEDKLVFGPCVHSLLCLFHASRAVFVRRIRFVIGKDRKHKHIHDILDVASISMPLKYRTLN